MDYALKFWTDYKFSSCRTPNSKKRVYLLKDLGGMVDGRVHLVADDTGYVGVLKFFMRDGEDVPEKLRKTEKEKADREHALWKQVNSGLLKEHPQLHVVVCTYNKKSCLLMPYACHLSSYTNLQRKNLESVVGKMIKKNIY